jgi:type III pantothenate kinase
MLVADVGNSRIKWGLCAGEAVVRAVALPDDADAWRRQLAEWRSEEPGQWTVAGVDPARRDRLVAWLRQGRHDVAVLEHASQIPLTLKIDAPERVGLDRVLNALAARALVAPGQPAVIVDAGSAVTVDLLDEEGAFAGGSIFPGLRLMAEALHDHTAQLPLINLADHAPVVPAKSTDPAIAAGVHWAVVGGVSALVRALHLAAPGAEPLPVFITGGDAAIIAPDLLDRHLYRYDVRPRLTLEGIRIAARKS